MPRNPRLLALRLEYDGTAYAGWQRQATGPSIQDALESAIRKVTGRPAAATAAGRTDAGVHAEGQVVHFRTRSALPLEKWTGALNAHLPPDVSVQEVWEPPSTFHARFGAASKTYVYRIWNTRGRPALLRHRAWHVPVPLSLAAMRRAARHLTGRHDFRAFAQTEGVKARTSTVRTVREIRIRREGPLVLISVTGDGFLTHMVRILAGTLAEVGRGKRTPDSVRETLRAKRRAGGGITAPAAGLSLASVAYPYPSRRRPRAAGSVTGARQAPPRHT